MDYCIILKLISVLSAVSFIFNRMGRLSLDKCIRTIHSSSLRSLMASHLIQSKVQSLYNGYTTARSLNGMMLALEARQFSSIQNNLQRLLLLMSVGPQSHCSN